MHKKEKIKMTTHIAGKALNINKNWVHIVMYIPGTVDPFNAKDQPYESDKNYWNGNNELYEKVNELKKTDEYELHVNKDWFSWSGDNNTKEREKAAKKLIKYLMDFYPRFQERWVSFHFIVHSHGGNVFNDFSRFIVDHEDFPKQWRIQTIIYLSTPFFKPEDKLHQVNTKLFNKKAKVINVFNQYDLTQRFIATYSLIQNHPWLIKIGLVDARGDTQNGSRVAFLLFISSFAIHKEALSPLKDKIGEYGKGTGKKIVDALLDILGKLLDYLKEVLPEINNLPDGRLKTTKQLFLDLYKKELNVKKKDGNGKTIIRKIEGGLFPWTKSAIAALKGYSTNYGKDYDRDNIFEALKLDQLLEHVVNPMLKIKDNKIPIISEIANISKELFTGICQTIQNPKDLYPEQYNPIMIDVTDCDIYDKRDRKKSFEGFIEKLEGNSENIYETVLVLLSLLINSDTIDSLVSQINDLTWVVEDELDQQLKHLMGHLKELKKPFEENQSNLIDPDTKKTIQKLDDMEPFLIDQDREYETIINTKVDPSLRNEYYSNEEHESMIESIQKYYQRVVNALHPQSRESITGMTKEFQKLKHQFIQLGSLDYLSRVAHSISRQKFYSEKEVLKKLKESIRNSG